MAKEPLVSIVIATFNRPELLKKALFSAISQDYKNLQIIVSDDAQNDDADDICKSFGDARVEYFKNDSHEKGPNGNKNSGFDAAKGEYICLLDDDDELKFDAISSCLAYMNDKVRCVFADCLCEKDGVLTGQISGVSPYKTSGLMSKIDYHCGRISGEYFKLFSREFIDGFRFDERSFGGENELYVRFFEKEVYYLKRPLYIYRIARPDSATLNASKHAIKVARAYLKSADLYYDIASKFEPSFLALLYKNAAYYAKMAGDYALMRECLLKSFRMKFSKEAFIFLLLSPLPNGVISSLSRLRVWMKR